MTLYVYIFSAILASVVSNPVLKYSFCPLWNPRCEATTFASDSLFEFGNISSGVHFIDPTQLVPPLSVSCASYEPLRWVLSANLDVRVHSISSDVTNNGTHKQYHYQINFNEASPGLIRCESYEDADRAAEIYIATRDPAEAYHQPETSLQAFLPSARKRGGQLVVPCNLIAFDSTLYDASTKWLKKIKQNVMAPLPASEECLSCFPQSPTQAANCTTSCHSTDCNDDGAITCSDHFSAMSAYPTKCKHDENVSSNFREIEACVVENFGRELNSTEADYDPRIGFRLKNQNDLDAVYVCGSSVGTTGAVYLMPLNPGERIEASLHVNDATAGTLNGLSCTVPQQSMEQDVLLQMLPCSTLFECETQLQTVEAQSFFRTSNNEILNRSELISSNLNTKFYGRIIKEPVRSGVVNCAASYRYDIGFIWDLKYFFTGVDSKIHFVSEDSPPEALMSLNKLKQTNFNQSPKEFKIQVECTVATFIVFPNLELFSEYSNGTISKISNDPVFEKSEDAFTDKPHLVSQKLMLKINDDDPIAAIRCRAHSRNCKKRVEAVLTMESIQRELYEEFLLSEANANAPPFFLVALPILTCVTLMSGMVAFGVYTVWREKRVKKWRQLTAAEANDFLNGNADLPTAGTKNEVNIDAMSFPKSYQIIPLELKTNLQEVLGEGQFGRCVKGQFHDMQVAVKTLKASSDVDIFKDFLREVKIMAYLGPHENIVQFLGAVVNQLRERVCLAVVELSPYGDLLSYLRKNDLESSSTGTRYANAPKSITNSTSMTVLGTNNLIYFCEQIAAAMEFLVSKNVIHGDLAARNVLVFPDNVVKITDFGLSRKLYTASNYKKKNDTPLPWGWMAIESLKYMEFSPKTDMWAYGVTVWEIFTLGQVPFAGFNYSGEFVDEVVGGRRLERPKFAQEEIYEFMMLTWDSNPAARPSFEDAKLFFKRIYGGTPQVCAPAPENSCYVVCT